MNEKMNKMTLKWCNGPKSMSRMVRLKREREREREREGGGV